jgi:RimJ/RimL family protein N-acetyltransferase
MAAPVLVPIRADGTPGEPLPDLPDAIAAVLESTASMYRGAGFVPPWTGYLAIEGGHCVGTCAFKRPPRDGRVEIAYFTFAGDEGRGVATRMAAALLAIAAAADPAVTLVAQTLPLENPSTAVLRKLGFALTGSFDSDEDGTVWVWERPAASD